MGSFVLQEPFCWGFGVKGDTADPGDLAESPRPIVWSGFTQITVGR